MDGIDQSTDGIETRDGGMDLRNRDDHEDYRNGKTGKWAIAREWNGNRQNCNGMEWIRQKRDANAAE
jgi:hypothetical protein